MPRLLKATVLDKFIDTFATMPADERVVTIKQLEGIHKGALAIEKRAAEWGKKFEAMGRENAAAAMPRSPAAAATPLWDTAEKLSQSAEEIADVLAATGQA